MNIQIRMINIQTIMSPREYFELKKKPVVMGILNILNLKLACFCVLSQNQHFFEI